MSDSTSQSNQSAGDRPPYRSRQEERAARRMERMEQRQARGVGGAWIGGAILILMGIIFLLQNLGAVFFGNWWALFILLPAFGAFARAWNLYQLNGRRLTASSRWALIGGIMLTMIAVFFLFNLNFGTAWPVFLILTGVGLLLNAMLPA